LGALDPHALRGKKAEREAVDQHHNASEASPVLRDAKGGRHWFRARMNVHDRLRSSASTSAATYVRPAFISSKPSRIAACN
jgi:hypothetical protein